MVANMGKMDRVIRILLGSGSLVASFMLHQLVMPVRIFLVIWGAVFLVTSTLGYWPAYPFAGVNTNKTNKAN